MFVAQDTNLRVTLNSSLSLTPHTTARKTQMAQQATLQSIPRAGQLRATPAARCLRAQMCLPVWETWVQSPAWKDPRKKETATRSSILAWEIPWTEKPGGLQFLGSQGVRHNLVAKTTPTANSPAPASPHLSWAETRLSASPLCDLPPQSSPNSQRVPAPTQGPAVLPLL